MYYYYYYYYPETIKVNFKINFKEKHKDPVALEQLLEFLNNINELHKVLLFLTQKEYEKDYSDLTLYKKDLLLSYHQLEVGKITRENPFFVELSFHVLPSGLSIYWTLWKILIKICKRYGKTSNDLKTTIEEVLNEDISLISSKTKQLVREVKIAKVLEKNTTKLEMSLFVERIKQWIFQLLTNPEFKKIYDSFCNTSIVITDLISQVEKFTNVIDLEDLIDNVDQIEFNLINNFNNN